MRKNITKTQELIIIEEKVSKMTIAMEKSPSLTMQFAAEELRRYLTKITGVNLPVKKGFSFSERGLIILGTHLTAKGWKTRLHIGAPEVDSFLIQTKDSNLLLLGNNDRGLLYSVYTFLENLGVRWLEPGISGEEIPKLSTLKIGTLNISETPAFNYRGFCVTACSPQCPQIGLTLGKLTKHQLLDLIDWIAKQRQNYLSFMSSWIEIERRGWMPEIVSVMKKRDLILEIGGHSWVNAPYGLGDNWHKDTKNFNYIAMLNGERKMPKYLNEEMTSIARTQLCVSNKEGVNKVIHNAIAYLKDNSQIDVFPFFASDTVNHWCECESCLRFSPTDLYLKVIFRLAKELRKLYPEKKVQFAAYQDTILPPINTTFASAPKNLIMLFCRWSCSLHTFDSAECTSKKPLKFTFPRNRLEIPSSCNNDWFRAVLKKWQKSFSGPVCMFDYSHFFVPSSPRMGYLLYPSLDIIKTDLQYYHKIGIAGHISVIYPLFSWPNALDIYILAKLNWNPEIDLKGSINEYYSQFYGELSQRIGKIFSNVKQTLNKKTEEKRDIKTIEECWNELKHLRGEGSSHQARERIDRACLYLKYVILRKNLHYCKGMREKKEVILWLRKFVNFLNKHRQAIQPYREVSDLIAITKSEIKH